MLWTLNLKACTHTKNLKDLKGVARPLKAIDATFFMFLKDFFTSNNISKVKQTALTY
jgi:hypothetical protein